MATAEANFDREPDEETTAQRRARFLARTRAHSRHLRTGAEILTSPSRHTDPPSDEELLAFLELI